LYFRRPLKFETEFFYNMSDAYQRNLETNVSKLIESYKTVLKKSALDNTHAPHENLQITAAAAAIVRI
jgi:hypothetical protein